jgi:hypothetical protein
VVPPKTYVLFRKVLSYSLFRRGSTAVAPTFSLHFPYARFATAAFKQTPILNLV